MLYMLAERGSILVSPAHVSRWPQFFQKNFNVYEKNFNKKFDGYNPKWRA
jgi:hypothetical protein